MPPSQDAAEERCPDGASWLKLQPVAALQRHRALFGLAAGPPSSRELLRVSQSRAMPSVALLGCVPGVA